MQLDMKIFDVIVGNPPYNPDKTRIKSNKVIWPEFVEIGFDCLADNGYLALIHPPNGRKPENKLWKTIYANNKILWLEMHHAKNGREPGIKVFGQWTSFDCYVLQKTKRTTSKVRVFGINGEEYKWNLDTVSWIPSGRFDIFKKILAKKNDEKLEIIHSYSSYEARKVSRQVWMNKTKTKKFKYPIAYTMNYKDGMVLWYSSRNDRGHFGVPKVICSLGGECVHAYNDYDGKYGISNFCFGIPVSSKNEAIKMTNFINSEWFKQFIKDTKWAKETEWRMFNYFKKDFYNIILEEDKKRKEREKDAK